MQNNKYGAQQERPDRERQDVCPVFEQGVQAMLSILGNERDSLAELVRGIPVEKQPERATPEK